MPTTDVATFPNEIPLEARRADLAALVAVTIATGFLVNRGDVLGAITSGANAGFYRRKSRTTTNGAGFSNASPIGHVVDASVFVPGDVLTSSTGTALGTIAANGVDPVNNLVTLTGNAANNLAAANDVIATDGSAIAQGVANEGCDGTAATPLAVFVMGLLLAASLRGLSTSSIAELGGALVADGIFKF